MTGKGPTKLFPERSRYARKVRFPREEVIWPAKFQPLSLSCLTRNGGVVVQLTAFQWQKWVVVSQLLKAP